MLFGEENLFASSEAPKEETSSFTPFSFWVVGHLFYIVGARDVGFGSEYAAVTELTIAADEMQHEPIISADSKLEIPVIDLCGIETTQ